MLVRLYAHSYSAEVVGMVLVDAQHEGQFYRIPAVQQAMQQVFARSNETLPLYRTLAATGIGALMPEIAAMTDNPALPSPAREAYSALLLSDPEFVEAQAAETASIFGSLAQVRAAQITSLGNIPLIVLYHGVADAPWPGMTLEEYTQWWHTLQTELAALSPQGELIVADQSGHYIQLDQPDLVISAIEQVLIATQS
jgi:pimeloyl-ACP methyl ester carboxylesterase